MIEWPRGWMTPLQFVEELAVVVLLTLLVVAGSVIALAAWPFLALVCVLDNLSLGLHPLYGLVRGEWRGTTGGQRWRPTWRREATDGE